MINHKLLCLLEGKCWHEWERIDKPPNNYVRERKYMCSKCTVVDDYPFENVDSPGYSSPNIYMPFLQWFWKERRGMWKEFGNWQWERWFQEDEALRTYTINSNYVWLFSLTTEGKPRIMVLLSEWLALPETREMWGWEECPKCIKGQEASCHQCNGTGHIIAEWAKEV